MIVPSVTGSGRKNVYQGSSVEMGSYVWDWLIVPMTTHTCRRNSSAYSPFFPKPKRFMFVPGFLFFSIQHSFSKRYNKWYDTLRIRIPYSRCCIVIAYHGYGGKNWVSCIVFSFSHRLSSSILVLVLSIILLFSRCFTLMTLVEFWPLFGTWCDLTIIFFHTLLNFLIRSSTRPWCRWPARRRRRRRRYYVIRSW